MQFVKTLAGRIRGAFGRLFRMARKFFRRSAGTLGAFVCRRTVALTLLLSVSLAVTAAAVSQTRFVTIRDGDNTIVVADSGFDGLVYATFDMRAIRQYRAEEFLGKNRKPQAYRHLLDAAPTAGRL